jgi:hypothetical protein
VPIFRFFIGVVLEGRYRTDNRVTKCFSNTIINAMQ